jgi:hypothetical protein
MPAGTNIDIELMNLCMYSTDKRKISALEARGKECAIDLSLNGRD